MIASNLSIVSLVSIAVLAFSSGRGGDQTFKLLPNDGEAYDRFGQAVAISGTTAIIGAFGDDHDNGSNSGSAYLFDTTTGLQRFKLLPYDGAEGDHFGRAVAIHGHIAIVGSWRDQDNGQNSGAAYLFDTATGHQIHKLLPNDGAAHDFFGGSVGISGGIAIVGAYGNDDHGESSGSAYLFDTATGQQIARLRVKDGESWDALGLVVAIGGGAGQETAIAGAPFDNDRGDQSGSAYLFDAAHGQCSSDLDGDGSVGVADLLALLANWGPCP